LVTFIYLCIEDIKKLFCNKKFQEISSIVNLQMAISFFPVYFRQLTHKNLLELFYLSKEVRLEMNTQKLTFVALAAMAVTMSVAMLVSSVATPVAAKITPPSCENPGGKQPPGQQPVCRGEGQTQNPATNPAGHAPPGQQP
jgi:hypothetical protein